MCIYDVVHNRVEECAKGAVDRTERASQPIPFFLSKVRNKGVRVLKERDEHQIGVHDDIGDDVKLKHREEGKMVHGGCNRANREYKESVTEHNHPPLPIRIDG